MGRQCGPGVRQGEWARREAGSVGRAAVGRRRGPAVRPDRHDHHAATGGAAVGGAAAAVMAAVAAKWPFCLVFGVKGLGSHISPGQVLQSSGGQLE